ncbi:MAG: HNH endonuclease [Pseudomonadota bacterium]|nr:HNH endonuclease [Pseudomonadota bacterium]
MAKAIFTTKVNPAYDDLPEIRYHFPRTYLNQVKAAVGDWIIYYEPRRHDKHDSSRGGRQAYFATARVVRIEADQKRSDHYYAFVSDYLEFDHPVPFKENSRYYEGALRRADGETNKGAFGRSVRLLEDEEYELILRAGFSGVFSAIESLETAISNIGFIKEPETFERPVIEKVINRPFRDAAFSRSVRSAYDMTCAMTGLRIVNGGGRPEVHAAHIKPVAGSGPDSVRNGIALCGTVHWMFDRGLVSVDDDYKILTVNSGIPEAMLRLLRSEGHLHLPKARELWPHPQFLHYHRNHVFKG